MEKLVKKVNQKFKLSTIEKQGSPALANGITAAGVAILLAGLVYVGMNIIFEYCNLYKVCHEKNRTGIVFLAIFQFSD